MVNRSFLRKQDWVRKTISGIIGGLFVFNMVSCGSNRTTTPLGDPGLDQVKSLTLSRVNENSIDLVWDLLKTDEGAADYTVVYTVYAETNDRDGGEVFEKDPSTETVYTLESDINLGGGRRSTVLPIDETGTRTFPVKVAGLVNHTPYRIIVEARESSEKITHSEFLVYTASALTNVDIIGVEATAAIDSKEVTVTWEPKEGAQSYLIQASEDENQFGGSISADKVFSVVCSPGFLLCESKDQALQQVGNNKLKYTFQVNHKGGKYKLALVPFNFQDIGDLRVVDETGKPISFIEEVLAQVEDESSILSSRLRSTIQDLDKATEIQVKVSQAGAPQGLVLDSTGSTLSASWGHGTGAEYYYVILSRKGVDAVTNIIDRYGSDGKFLGGGYVGFSNLSPNTTYTVTVQSLTVVDTITNVGKSVSATRSTKDVGITLDVPERITGEDLTLINNNAGRLRIAWDTPEANSVVGYNVFYWVGEVAPNQPQYVAGKGKNTLTFTVAPGNYHVRIDVLSIYPGKERVEGEEGTITVYGKPEAPRNIGISFSRGSFVNIANKLYAVGYPLTYTEASTPVEAGGPVEDVTYHYRYQVQGGRWIGYSEITNEAVISLQVDDLSDAAVIKSGYGKSYQVQVMASNAGGFMSTRSLGFSFKSFPEPFIQKDHLQVESGDRSLTTTWPKVNEVNGSDVASYTVNLEIDRLPIQRKTVPALEQEAVFEGLINNQPYHITVIPNSAVTGSVFTALSMVTGYTVGDAIEEGSPEDEILTAYVGVPDNYIPQGAIDAVVDLVVTAGNNEATVTWIQPSTGSRATNYVLEYLTGVTIPLTTIDKSGDAADAELSELSWAGASLVNITTNHSGSYSHVVRYLNVTTATNVFRVKGIRSDDFGQEWESPYRYYALGTEPSRAPSSVGELKFIYEEGGLVVRWKAPDNPGINRNNEAARLVGYWVFWGSSAEKIESSFEINNPNTLEYRITGLTSGNQYYVLVRAKNDNPEGNIYNVGSSKTTYTLKKPGAVVASAIRYSEHTTNSFKVSWDAVTDAGYGPEGPLTSAVSYHLELIAQGGNRNTIRRSNPSATEETLTGLDPGTRYRVSITVVNEFTLHSDISVGGETWTLSSPGQVGGLTVSDPNYDETTHRGGFKVSWDAPQDTGRTSTGDFAVITGYEVAYAERAGDNTGQYTSHESITNEYVFTGLKTNTEYDIRIQAKNAVGTGRGTHTSGWTPSLPGVVDSDSITFSLATAKTIRIAWTAPEPGRAGGSSASDAVTLYQVEIAPDGGEYALVRDNYSGNAITVSNLDRSTSYRARVAAKNAYGVVAASVSASTGTTTEKDSAPPSPVENLKVDSVTSSQVVLSWARPTNTGTTEDNTLATLSGYTIKYKKTVDSGFTEIDEKSEKVRLTEALTNISTTARVIGLTPNTTYTFLVVAINSANEATSDAEANTVEGTTLSAATPPAQPLLSVSNYGVDVYLNWTVEHFGSNADGSAARFSSYLVEENDGTEWSQVTIMDEDTMSYVYRGRDVGTYIYRVSVSNTATPPQRGTSAEVSVTIAAATAPGSPTAFATSKITTTSISLTWESPGDAGKRIGGIPATILGYRLQYKASSDNDWLTFAVSNTTWTVSNLVPHTSYDFRLYASNDAHLLSETPAGFVKTTSSAATPPAQPLLSVSNYGVDVYLSWTVEHFGSNADGSAARFSSYLVEENDGTQWNQVTTIDENTMSYVHRVSDAGTNTYRVSVSNTATPPQGSTSAEVSAIIAAATAPGSPTAFIISEITSTSISLTWESPGDAGTNTGGIPAIILGYHLQYKASSDNDWLTLGVSNTTWTVSNLASRTSYDFRLYASNDAHLLSETPAELLNNDTLAVRIDLGGFSLASVASYKVGESTAVTTEDGNKNATPTITVAPTIPGGSLTKVLTYGKSTSVDLRWPISPAVSYTYNTYKAACLAVGCSGDADSFAITTGGGMKIEHIIATGKVSVGISSYNSSYNERSQESFS